MQLTPGQLRPLWKLLDAAWKAHCKREGVAAPDAKAKEAWRHEVMLKKVGVSSLKHVPKSGPMYAQLMAALEIETRAGIDWQIQAMRSELALAHRLRELLEELEIDEGYARGVARQALRLPDTEPLPEFCKMTPDQLRVLLRVFFAQGRRITHAAEEPF